MHKTLSIRGVIYWWWSEKLQKLNEVTVKSVILLVPYISSHTCSHLVRLPKRNLNRHIAQCDSGFLITQRTSAPVAPLDAEADFISAESLGLTLRRRSRGDRHSYIQLCPRNSPGKFRRLFEQCRARKLSRRIPIRRFEGQKRMSRNGMGGQLSRVPRGWTRYLYRWPIGVEKPAERAGFSQARQMYFARIYRANNRRLLRTFIETPIYHRFPSPAVISETPLRYNPTD